MKLKEKKEKPDEVFKESDVIITKMRIATLFMIKWMIINLVVIVICLSTMKSSIKWNIHSLDLFIIADSIIYNQDLGLQMIILMLSTFIYMILVGSISERKYYYLFFLVSAILFLVGEIFIITYLIYDLSIIEIQESQYGLMFIGAFLGGLIGFCIRGIAMVFIDTSMIGFEPYEVQKEKVE